MSECHDYSDGIGASDETSQPKPVLLRATGHDEHWLQDRLSRDPELLGLGDVRVLGQEVKAVGGSRLDILAERDDTYYSVEVQLGSVDASHAFRVLEYWAYNRRVRADKSHVAVLIAEKVDGRRVAALMALAEYMPLLVIELGVSQRDDATLILTPRVIIANESLEVDALPAAAGLLERTEADWRAHASDEAWAAFQAFVKVARREVGVWVEYGTASYVGIKQGRRLWAIVRFSANFIIVNLPDPDQHVGGSPSEAFKALAREVSACGVGLQWQPSSNAGAQPINARLRAGDLEEPVVEHLITSTLRAQAGGLPYSAEFGPAKEHEYYSAAADWTGEFDPYYTIESVEGGYGGPSYVRLDYWPAADDWQIIWSAPDDDWAGTSGTREFARRVLVHLLEKEPTQRLIDEFTRGPAKDFDPGDGWTKSEAELRQWLDEVGA